MNSAGVDCGSRNKLRTRLKNFLISFVGVLIWCSIAAAIAQGDERQILDAASVTSRQASGYHIDASVENGSTKSLISADIAGDDYDITVNSVTRVRGVRGRYWSSQDGGKTWHDSSPDTALFYFLKAPLNSGGLPSNAKLVTIEQRSEGDLTVTLLELRPDPLPEKELLIHYSIVRSSGGKIWMSHFSGPVTFLGGVVLVDAKYSKFDEVSKIMPPRPK